MREPFLIALDDAVRTEWANRTDAPYPGCYVLREREMRSYAAFNHRDANHKPIVSEMRQRGLVVEEILQPLDLLVWDPAGYGNAFTLMEIKMPGSRARWTRKQLEFIASTRLPVAIVTNIDEAYQAAHWQVRLTQPQKDRLAGFLIRHSDKFFQPSEIEKVLAG